MTCPAVARSPELPSNSSALVKIEQLPTGSPKSDMYGVAIEKLDEKPAESTTTTNLNLLCLGSNIPGLMLAVAKITMYSLPPIVPDEKVKVKVPASVMVALLSRGGLKVGLVGAVAIVLSMGTSDKFKVVKSCCPDGVQVPPMVLVRSQSPRSCCRVP